MITQEDRIKKAHISMMKHPKTVLYSAVLMMGTSSVEDAKITAYTDGINKKYGRAFLEHICTDIAEVRGLVLHENLHITLRHLLHNRDLFLEDKELANKAADYVVNDIIVLIDEPEFIRLPKGGLHDIQYRNMNMREVYRKLKKDQEEGGGGKCKPPNGEPEDGEGDGEGGYSFDEHDIDGNHGMEAPLSQEEAQKIDDAIDRALREGAILAGRLGLDIPRAISEAMEIRVDWRKELREFMSTFSRGAEEHSWRRFDRRHLANDIYLPSKFNESMGEIVIAIDTSGSIGQEQLSEFAGELASIGAATLPEKIRVLWWDTMVHGQQVFTDNYEQIGAMLKPLGGGGTRVGCVSEYIGKHNINAECVIVFTDGYVESTPAWTISVPTLWLVTQNRNWNPPAGTKVFVE